MVQLKVGNKPKRGPRVVSFTIGKVRLSITAFWTLLLNVVLSLLTLWCYRQVTVPPDANILAPFLAYGIPVLMAVQLVFAAMWGLRAKPVHFIFPLLTLAMGYPHIRSTLAINISPDVEHHDLKVVSYNIRMMQGYGLMRERTRDEADALVEWLMGTKADVICLQEFYNSPERFGFDFDSLMADVGLKYHYFSKANRSDWMKGNLGMCVYSRYPMSGGKTLYKDIKRNNQILHCDITTPKGKIRVFNVHLHSLQLKERELETNTPSDQLKQNAKVVGSKLKTGFQVRRQQVAVLDSALAANNLPVLVCGDFNDMPYSYTYYTMRQRLGNAFEAAGSGFDFSFNGKIPFLRIDNQFYSSEFKVLNFETWDNVAYSDHFPIVGWYQLP